MTKEQIKNFLKEKPGYLKVGPERLSERLDCSVEACAAALTEVRLETRGSDFDIDKDFNVENNNESVITEFQTFLDTNDIAPTDVSSVKFWQTMSGQQRFSVVTKNEGRNVSEIKKEIEDFAAIYSPVVPKASLLNKLSDPVVYEVSLPDIHYGKVHGYTLKEIEHQFIGVVKDLVEKAKGLDIERFLLPIGNDGMNSEGMRRTTTKGTPQEDSASWKETFRGYWALMVTAIDYLKTIAPVDVIVISGNHDYERMFYAGDVISGWYRNDKNVTVDNSEESRKYYEYGVNMIMLTHGDNEKAAEMPLIMATEQPEMFARSTHREAHCGHFHKEMVNEYRGVKVRFIPSICPNDEWHKRMGYAAKRTGQAYIWNKEVGLEGYLQSNIRG
tara:strand:- start:1119 stop:2279 length:1161 start_codon:yes stop_codon:yes gene_type:complete